MPDPPVGEIRAAGAVVWRSAADGEQVALIHRRRYDDWSFPKGKCEPGEHVLVTAVREVAEETGTRVILGRRLRATRYRTDGRRKRVNYWAAYCQQAPAAFAPNDEVDELEWLPVPKARGRLSYQHDIQLLDEFAAGPAQTSPFILLRHAGAGRKADWLGNDLARPLDPRGAADADALALLLSCFGSAQVISSAAERCVATIRPYAALTGAQIELERLFTTGEQCHAATAAARSRAAALAGVGRPVLICAHRENLPLLLDAACARLGSGPEDRPTLRKGGFWVLHCASGSLVSAEHHHPAGW
jgi:8-oxo-(d)GTP phosphatase